MPSSLIHEMQLDAANANVSVSNLLRKVLIVAAKLDVADIPDWVDKELSGYSSGDQVPPYRIVHGMVMARQHGGWVPVQFPTNDLQETVSEKYIFNTIAEIEALSKRNGQLRFGFPAEAQQLLQDLFQRHAEFGCFLEKSILDGILDEIRNQVLRWAIALEKAGIRGEGLTFTGAEKERAQSVVLHHSGSGTVNVGVIGDVAGQSNVATGNAARAGNISAEDIQALINEVQPHISAIPLSNPDRDALHATLAELAASPRSTPPEPSKVRQLLKRALGVLGKARETVISAGTKAFIEAWMKQHGMSP